MIAAVAAQQNFMLADLRAITQALLLFSLFAFVPGYVFGWFADLLEFRRRSLPLKITLSVPLSLSICPILVYQLGRWFSMRAVWGMYGVLWLCFLVILARGWRKDLPGAIRVLADRKLAVFFLIVVGWVLVCTLLLVDVQAGHRLYFPTVSWDYAVRTPFTDAITRTGVPPSNPYSFPGHPVPLRYHYFWLLPCSLVDQLGGQAIGPRDALIAGTVWCGIGLISIVAVYLRLFGSRGRDNTRRRALIGIGLLGVTGLDILPVILYAATVHWLLPSLEWWNNTVMSWIHAVLWVPLHTAGMIICLTGLLLLWSASSSASLRRALAAGVFAGLAFASALGTSIYLTFVCAIFLVVWTLITIDKGWYRETALLATAGVVALALSIPYLLDLRTGGSGGALFQIQIRTFRGVDVILKTTGIDLRWGPLLDLLFLPLNYFLEFGLFFVVGVLRVRSYRKNRAPLPREDLFALVLFGVSLLICTFLRSSVISNNDLGWRGMLFAQFVLLLWAVDLIEHWKRDIPAGAPASGRYVSPRLRILMTILLSIGVAGTLYEAVVGRTFPMLSDTGKVAPYRFLAMDRKLGERSYALRQVYEQLDRTLPETAIVQNNPDVEGVDLFYGLFAHRQTVAHGRGCGTTFGGDEAWCKKIFPRLRSLYAKGVPVTPDTPDAICRDLSIDVLVVRDTDPVWSDKNSWVWKRQPLLGNDFVRAFRCAM